jgi:hypothetical protein
MEVKKQNKFGLSSGFQENLEFVNKRNKLDGGTNVVHCERRTIRSGVVPDNANSHFVKPKKFFNLHGNKDNDVENIRKKLMDIERADSDQNEPNNQNQLKSNKMSENDSKFNSNTNLIQRKTEKLSKFYMKNHKNLRKIHF